MLETAKHCLYFSTLYDIPQSSKTLLISPTKYIYTVSPSKSTYSVSVLASEIMEHMKIVKPDV
jgi:hypothetical protein